MKPELFLEGSLAKTRLAREEKGDLTASDQDCGGNFSESLRQPVQLSLSLKIPKDCDIGDCWTFSGLLPKAGTMRSGKLSRQDAPLARLTGGKESSLWPTPTTYPPGSEGVRVAGQNALERKLKQIPSPSHCLPNYLEPILGSEEKMSSDVPRALMQFPPGWAEKPLLIGAENGSLQNIRGVPKKQDSDKTKANLRFRDG